MNGSRRVAIVAVILAGGMMYASPAHAGNALTKLGRGVGNAATGWMEIPSQVAQVNEAEGSIAGMSVGLVKGFAYGIGRTLVGLAELVTFPIPNHVARPGDFRADSYDPIIQPEFVDFRRGDKL